MKQALLVVFVVVAGAAPAQSQDADRALLHAIYAWQAPAATLPLRALDKTAYPAFALVPAATYAATGDWQPALRVAAAEGAAGLLVFGVKHAVQRPRPYAAEPGIRLRTGRADQAVLKRDSYSFPSGHTALAFAAATTLALDHPQWYVVVPAYVWAGGVGVSRVWHGAHYPSDVLAGAALGFVVAGAVHRLWPESDGEQVSGGVPVGLRIQF